MVALDSTTALLLQFPVGTGNASISAMIVYTHLFHFLNRFDASASRKRNFTLFA